VPAIPSAAASNKNKVPMGWEILFAPVSKRDKTVRSKTKFSQYLFCFFFKVELTEPEDAQPLTRSYSNCKHGAICGSNDLMNN